MVSPKQADPIPLISGHEEEMLVAKGHHWKPPLPAKSKKNQEVPTGHREAG